MSLERTALRLAAMMALTNGQQAPYPTLAGLSVWDSRMDPLEGMDPETLVPTILIYTDTEHDESLSGSNGGPPWRPKVNLVLEISIGQVKVEDQDQPYVVQVETDPELEMMLDLLEHQIQRQLRHPTNKWGVRLLEKSMVRIEGWQSDRFLERSANARLAVRQIVATVQLPQPEEPTIAAPGSDVAPTIPEPLGSLIQAIIDDAGPYAESADAMKNHLLQHGGFGPLELHPLTTVRFKEANEGGGFRPDGVAQANLPQS